MASASDFLIVFVTVDAIDTAESIATTLIQERLAACVNLIPQVHSYYIWQDELRRDTEILMIIKTTIDAYKALEQKILELHPYEVPEVLAVSIVDGCKIYLDWLNSMVSS